MNFGDMKSITIEGIAMKSISINGVEIWREPASYTNQVPLSIDTDGSIFNGMGYQDEKRLSSSGVTKDKVYCTVTGYIPVSPGDTIRIAGCDWMDENQTSHNYICAYDANFNFLCPIISTNYTYGYTTVFDVPTGDGEVSIIKLLSGTNVSYIRVSAGGTSEAEKVVGADLIVTVNEEIT